MPSTTPFSTTAAPSTAVSTVVVAMMLTGMSAKTAHASICTNTCQHPNDGDCDDGGPDHDYSGCAYGTDCDDCGERCDLDQIQDPVTGQCVSCGNAEEANEPDYDTCIPCDRPNTITFDTTVPGCVITECNPGFHIRTGGGYCDPAPEGPGCGHTCEYADDGWCDDGGPGAWYADCELGSDCGDCGLRCPDGQVLDPTSGQCVTCGNKEEPNPDYTACIPCERHNATQFADAPGCVITECDLQYNLHIRTGGQFCDPYQEGPGCNHSCEHADDGTCDDGGPGSHYSACAYGSDCRDCGERETLNCTSKTEFRHNSTDAWCEPCQRENALDFADVADSCVIIACVPGYHLNVNGNVSTCDMYKEGHGCNNDCLYNRDGECDDGSQGLQYCHLGTDCEDCGLQCGHTHEEHHGECIACERPGAAHFEDAEGCVIHNCSEDHTLTDAGTCEPNSGPNPNTPNPGPNPNTPNPGPNPTPGPGATPIPGPNPSDPLTEAPPTSREVGNANTDDDGFNPAWLALLLIPVLALVGVGVFCAMKRNGGSGNGSVKTAKFGADAADEELLQLPADGDAPAAEAEPEAEANPILDGNEEDKELDL